MSRIALRACSCALMVVAACGDDGGSGGNDVAVDSVAETQPADTAPADSAVDTVAPADTTEPEADTALPPATLTIQFVDTTFDGPAVSGVGVIWTLPGGERVEMTTGADGKAALRQEIDWSKGPIAIVGRKADYVVHGATFDEAALTDPLIVRNADGDIFLQISPLQGPPMVTLRGNATGMINEGHNLIVTPDFENAPFAGGSGPSFEILVPPDTPSNWAAFTWVANGQGGPHMIDNTIEQWAVGTFPGSVADFTYDIDLVAGAIEPKKVSGSYPLFASPNTTLDETGWPRVAVLAHAETMSGFIGGVSKSVATEGNASIEYDLEWIEPEWATSPTTRYSLDTNSEVSLHSVPGWPTAGAQEVALPPPPSWPSLGSHPIDEPLTWTNEAPELFVTVIISGGPSGSDLAYFNLPPGVTSFTLPELPGGVDLFEHAGVAVLGANVVLCGIEEWSTYCSRFSRSKRVPLSAASP